MSADPTRLDAAAQASAVREGRISARALLRAHLAVVARLNPVLNAICTLDEAGALAAADAADAALARGAAVGRLHGVPIGIKDVTATAGLRTTYGSPMFRDHVPARDAAIVTRLREAGAIILGKTNTPEFATGATTNNAVFGASRNPWDPRLTPSGSTGGGAAALASGMIALAEGTDYGGSLRTPAAFCGVVGLRPTPGLVPCLPAADPWDPGYVAGGMARNAADLALMLDVIAGPHPDSPISVPPPWTSAAAIVARGLPAGLRARFTPDIAGIGVEPEIEAACRAAAEALAGAGVAMQEASFDLADGRAAYLALRAEWMLVHHGDRLDRLDELGANLRGNIAAGLALPARDLAAARRVRAAHWQRWRTLFATTDLLLTPTTPLPPFPVEHNAPAELCGRPLGSYIDWIAPTFLVTLSGVPAVSVPCGLTASGLPIGLQIIGPRLSEPLLLAVAAEVARRCPLGWPPGPPD